MKTLFKDVANFYIGCKLHTPEGTATFNAFYPESEHEPIVCFDTVKSDWHYADVKPILRTLESLTEAEQEAVPVANKVEGNRVVIATAEITRYLLGLRIDLFDLIACGEALDADSLSINPYKPQPHA